MSDGYRIYRVKTDGTGRERVNDEYSDQLVVSGDWMYYISLPAAGYSKGYLCRKKLDGSVRQKITTDPLRIFTLREDLIFYTLFPNNILCKINIDGKNKEKYSDIKCQYINITSEWLFYYETAIEGSGTQVFLNNEGRYRLNIINSKKESYDDF